VRLINDTHERLQLEVFRNRAKVVDLRAEPMKVAEEWVRQGHLQGTAATIVVTKSSDTRAGEREQSPFIKQNRQERTLIVPTTADVLEVEVRGRIHQTYARAY
jgi:hypothetical protein